MKKNKSILFILFISTIIVWIFALTIFKDPDLIMYLAGAILGELVGIGTLLVLPPKYDGDLVIKSKPDGSALYTLDLDSNPEEWAKMDEIILKVKPEEDG